MKRSLERLYNTHFEDDRNREKVNIPPAAKDEVDQKGTKTQGSQLRGGRKYYKIEAINYIARYRNLNKKKDRKPVRQFM